jgi:TP901 family phage tail tape measure protein
VADLNVRILLELIDKTSQSSDKIKKNLKGIAKAGKSATKSFQLAASLNQAAEGVARLGEQAKRLLIKPVVDFTEFEKAIVEVSTLVDESVISNQELIDITEQAAITFGGKAADQAKALYQTISAGASNAAEATDLLTAANKLAIGGVTDVETAVDGLTSALNAFGISFEDAGRVSDSFFVAVKGGKTTVEELASSIGKVAPIAAAMGLSVEETNAAIATLTKQGINTKFAVSGLKAAFANILKPSSEAAEEAERLGIDFSVAALEAKGLQGFLSDVTKTSGLSQEALADLAKQSGGNAEVFQVLIERAGGNIDSLSKLFGSIEGINAVLALTSNQGKEFAAQMKLQAEGMGASEIAAAKMAKTQAQAFERAKGELDALTREVGEAFTPAVNEALADVLDMAKGIKEFAEANPRVVRELGGFLIKLVAFSAALRTTLLLTSTLSGAKGLLGVIGPLARVATGAEKGATAMKALSGGIKASAGGIAGAAGLALLALAAGVALGTMLDKALGLSDILAGLNKKVDKFGRAAPALRETLTTEERGKLLTAEQNLAAAQKERKELSEGFTGAVLSEQGLDLVSNTDERIEEAKAIIDQINAAGRGRQKRFGAAAADVGEVELELGRVTPEQQAALARREQAAAAAAKAELLVRVQNERTIVTTENATDTDVTIDGGIAEVGA